MSRKWIAGIGVLLLAVLAFGVGSASAVKRIGNLYPVQGVFVSFCTDTNTPNVTPDCNFTQSTQTWVDLPGAYSQDINAGNGAVIFARFSAQTRCTGGSAGSPCLVRMRLYNVGTNTFTLMRPSPAPDGIGIRFDTSPGSGAADDGTESHAVEQVIPKNIAAGTYRVYVQVSVTTSAGGSSLPSFNLRSWTLATEVAF